MHLVPRGKRQPHCSGPLHQERRQYSASTGQRNLLLPGDHSLGSVACITPKHKVLQKWDHYITSDGIMVVGGSQSWKCCCATKTKICSEISPQIDAGNITMLWFRGVSNMLCGWKKDSRKMYKDYHIDAEALLWGYSFNALLSCNTWCP